MFAIRRQSGFSLTELLVILAISGLVAVLSINLLVQNPSNPWGRVVDDYIRHLGSVYSQTVSRTGLPPSLLQPFTAASVNTTNETIYIQNHGFVTGSAVTPSNYSGSIQPTGLTSLATYYVRVNGDYLTFYDTAANAMGTGTTGRVNLTSTGSGTNRLSSATSIAGRLLEWETIARLGTSGYVAYLDYPSKVRVYLNPYIITGFSDPTLTNTNNLEWIMMDMNGDDGPNSLSSGGDRVLLYIENSTGRILTAYQKCQELSVATYGKSFYDDYKGY